MLSNKHIVIIGGTSGIGLSAAQAFIRHGAKVVVVGPHPDTNQQAQDLLGAQGLVYAGDATQEETAPGAIDLCLKQWGSLDGLYHVAGGSGRRLGDGPLHEVTTEGWHKTLSLNLTSVMFSNRAAISAFLKAGKGGSILNVGSVLGYAPAPQYFATHTYATAKAAIIGLSKSAASYYAKDNIRINVLAPGLVETPMAQRAAADPAIMDYIKTKQPLDGGRIGRTQDLEEAACYFMSDYATFITGQVLAVDGGWSLSEGQISSKFM